MEIKTGDINSSIRYTYKHTFNFKIIVSRHYQYFCSSDYSIILSICLYKNDSLQISFPNCPGKSRICTRNRRFRYIHIERASGCEEMHEFEMFF